jgi:membrane-associated protease RseP (regulator of RpoE activity)
MSTGNGNGHFPTDLATLDPPQRVIIPRRIRKPRPERPGLSLAIALTLFVATIISTLAAGVDFSLAYAQNRMPSFDDFFQAYILALHTPSALLTGLPFAFTLMGILLAHELGHFFACRYYHTSASFPYFIPAPTLVGTMGAFIRIRSAIVNRKALFDIGISGPIVGFIFAAPALAIAILHSKVAPGVESGAPVYFGVPLLMKLLTAILRPGVSAGDLLLNPVGRAAWVGLFVTSLNLLPGGQLDGGHILYSLASGIHKRATFIVAIALVPLALEWPGWLVWAALLLALSFRHPPLMDRFELLDRKRYVWAAVGVAIFVLSFMPAPFISRDGWWWFQHP